MRQWFRGASYVGLFFAAGMLATALRADPINEPVPDPSLKPCTVRNTACPTSFSLFGTCCLSAQGLGTTRAAQSGESKTALPGTDPCGAEFTFFVYPCARANNNNCGGNFPSTEDCNYQNPL
jgi:hypothetical protein